MQRSYSGLMASTVGFIVSIIVNIYYMVTLADMPAGL